MEHYWDRKSAYIEERCKFLEERNKTLEVECEKAFMLVSAVRYLQDALKAFEPAEETVESES